MLNKSKYILFLSLTFIFVFANAQQTTFDVLTGYDSTRTITTAVPFLTIAPDARSGAMGETGVALSPDANSIHWNTAKLAFVEDDYAFSTSYTPWLRNIINDMALSYLSGYYRMNERSVYSASLLYFDLGEITFTDENGNELRTHNPKEFALTAGYGTQLSEKLGLGLNLKYITSNLSGSIGFADGTQTRPGRTAAGDVSIYYKSPISFQGKPSDLTLAATVSNVGAKIAYTNSIADNKDFLPANLKLGGAMKTEIDQFQSFTVALDLNKYLVPSPPVYDPENTGVDPVILLGSDPDLKSVPAGIFGSFTDAPGVPVVDDDGNVTADKGSRFREEISEIIISAGAEYWYRDVLAFRAGFFNEAATKGNRKFLTFGFGVKYQFLGIDVAYLSSLTQNSPLANTLRFSLHFNFNSEDQSAPKPTNP